MNPEKPSYLLSDKPHPLSDEEKKKLVDAMNESINGPEVIHAEIVTAPDPGLRLEPEAIVKPETKTEEKKKTAGMTKKFDSKLFRIPKRPSTGMADAIRKWQDEHDQ